MTEIAYVILAIVAFFVFVFGLGLWAMNKDHDLDPFRNRLLDKDGGQQ